MRFPFLRLYRRLLQLGAIIILISGAALFLEFSLKEEIKFNSETGNLETEQSFEFNSISLYMCLGTLWSTLAVLIGAEVIALFLSIEEHQYNIYRILRKNEREEQDSSYPDYKPDYERFRRG